MLCLMEKQGEMSYLALSENLNKILKIEELVWSKIVFSSKKFNFYLFIFYFIYSFIYFLFIYFFLL